MSRAATPGSVARSALVDAAHAREDGPNPFASPPDAAAPIGTTAVDVAPAGRFLVVGDCRGLWWSDGTRWVELEPGADGARSLCRKLVDR
mgnify:CR=1 FL=1